MLTRCKEPPERRCGEEQAYISLSPLRLPGADHVDFFLTRRGNRPHHAMGLLKPGNGSGRHWYV